MFTVLQDLNETYEPSTQSITVGEDVEMLDTKNLEHLKDLHFSSRFVPICNRLYDTSEDSILDVVPRRTYFVNRTLTPELNVVWILAEMLDSKAVEDSLLTCQLNGYYSKIKVTREDTGWVRNHYPGHSHCTTFIQCTGFPKEAIRNGSTVSIIYKRPKDSCYSQVATEKPLVLLNSNKFTRNTIVICGAFYGDPPFTNEWLKYQKTLGVDKVHLNVEKSFSDNAIARYPFLEEALNSSFVEMEVWESYVGNKIYYFSQVTKIQDCVMRYGGIFEFALVCDTDDFFLPMTSQKNIHYYTNKLFSDPKVASVRLPWKAYWCKRVAYEPPPGGNMTQTDLVNCPGKWTSNFKSIHRINAIKTIAVHTAVSLQPGYRSVTGDKKLAYVVHVRPQHSKPKPKK